VEDISRELEAGDDAQRRLALLFEVYTNE